MIVVDTRDWFGIDGEYEVLNLNKKEPGKYSCTFRNSEKELEIFLVDEKDLKIKED